MAISRKTQNEKFKQEFLVKLQELLSSENEDVLRVASGALALPFVNANGDDEWLKVTISVPTGTREGEPYDGYADADNFKLETTVKAEKAEQTAAAKAKKILKDTETRKKKAEQKAAREE